MRIYRAAERGHFNFGWLDTYHTFSFGEFHDPSRRGFRNLRVINEDRVQPAKGFAPHAHADMEILTYVIEGALEHKDSMGNHFVVHSGEIQRMSAGTGVQHSEYNASDTAAVHLIQIWIKPSHKGTSPSYQQIAIDKGDKRDRFCMMASPKKDEGKIQIFAGARVLASILSPQKELTWDLAAGHGAFVYIVSGDLQIGSDRFLSGDGIEIEAIEKITLRAHRETEFLFFDLD